MSGSDFPKRSLSHDNYLTDAWLMSIFENWFDPCPLNPNWEINGLEIEWENKTFVNPPYSKPKPWVAKAIEENKKGHTIVMLLKHDSSTQWFSMLHEAGARFLPIIGRLRYGTKKPAAFPSLLAVLS